MTDAPYSATITGHDMMNTPVDAQARVDGFVEHWQKVPAAVITRHTDLSVDAQVYRVTFASRAWTGRAPHV